MWCLSGSFFVWHRNNFVEKKEMRTPFVSTTINGIEPIWIYCARATKATYKNEFCHFTIFFPFFFFRNFMRFCSFVKLLKMWIDMKIGPKGIQQIEPIQWIIQVIKFFFCCFRFTFVEPTSVVWFHVYLLEWQNKKPTKNKTMKISIQWNAWELTEKISNTVDTEIHWTDTIVKQISHWLMHTEDRERKRK